MRYRVLGTLAVFADDDTLARLGGPRQRLVLALLLRDAGRTVSDDTLVDALWPDDPPAGARHTIQTYISQLRGNLDDDIRRVGVGYLLDVDRDAVDAHRFVALVDAARERMADAPAAAAALLREALALWHGEPYADLHEAEALRDEIHRLEQARVEAVEDRLAADLEVGRHAHVILELEGVARDYPFRERLHGLLMVALYRSGRQAEALHAYERVRSILAAELGLDPSPELQRLHMRILEQDPALLAPVEVGVEEAAPEVVRGFELRTRLVGRGALTVWRAYQTSASREVTVTIIAPHEANAPGFVRSFEPHAQQLARLDHAHLLPLLDHWRDPRGAYLVSPLARDSVRTTLQRATWSAPAALRLVDQVSGALTELHQADLVHGDVNAATVFLDDEGNALLSTAAVIAREAARADVVAPEVRLGRPPGIEADVFGLAALALEALTGTTPSPEGLPTALAHARRSLPDDVAQVLARATAEDPAARHRRPETLVRELRQAIGADVVGLAEDEAAVTSVRNPYKGLRAFQEADAPDFHGRDALIDELVQAVSSRRLVAVVGPSGSGKSSLVRAGMVPALRGQEPEADWLFADLFPGAHPFEELEAALLRIAVDRPDGLLTDLLADERAMVRVVKQILPPDGELVLIIDQLEELYSLTMDLDLRRLFLDGLVALAENPAARVRTVLTLRADFFDRPLQHHAFGTLVREGLVTVGMPSPQEIARAISQPARRVGVSYEPGLIETIARDVSDQPGALPLLQHALTELFERRDGRVLTAGAYQTTGGVLGALGRRADKLYGALAPAAQSVTEQVFLRLVTVNERGEDVRRRVRRNELRELEADPTTVEEIIRVFGSHRLLSFDRDPVTRTPTIEVAHEALFGAWEPLRGWIEARRDDLRFHRRLNAAVTEWQQGGETGDYLLTGARLDQFERWAATTRLALTARERAFLTASRNRDEQLAARRQRRRRSVVGALGTAAILAIVLAMIALAQAGRARTGEQVALSRELAAESRLQQAVDHDVSLLLAVEAVEVARDAGPEHFQAAIAALHEALLGHRLLSTADVGGTLVAAAGADERVFVSGPPSNRAALWDLATGETLAVLRDDGREPFQAAVSADGRRAVETFMGQPTLVWDLDAAELLHEIAPPLTLHAWPALSFDGRLLAVANMEQFQVGRDQTISLWDLDDGSEVLRIPHEGNARHLVFSPDARVLAVADMQNAVVRLYDLRTGDVLRMIGDPTDSRGVHSVAFRASGHELAMFVFAPRELRIVDLESEDVLVSVPMGTASIGARLCYSHDGDMLAVATGDGLLSVYDATGLHRMSLPGSRAIESLACASTGDRVVLATDEGVVRLWGLAPDHAGEVLSITAPPPFSGVWAPDGEALLTTHWGGDIVADPDRSVFGTLHRYDVASRRLLAEADDLHPFPPWWLVISPDGRHVATNANPFGDIDPAQADPGVPRSARLVIHDAVTLDRVHEIEGGGWPLGFSADSSQLLVGGAGRVRVADVTSGDIEVEVVVVPPDADSVLELGGGGFVGDGRHVVATAHLGREGWIVDVESHQVVALFCGAGGGSRAAVSPDGSIVAVGSATGITEIWDVSTLVADGGSTCEEEAKDGLVRTLEGDAALDLSFNAQGDRLAAAGFDGVVTVWDVETGETRLRIEHDAQVGGAAFSPDGHRLLVTVNDAGGTQHAVHVYTLDPDELVAIARDRATRELTLEECQTFLADRCP